MTGDDVPDAGHRKDWGVDVEEERENFKKLLKQRGLAIPPEIVIKGDVDCTVDRFLRARKYDLDASFNMLEASVGWRRQEDINKQVSHPLSAQKMLVIRKCRPSSYVGFDKLGRPVYVDRVGKLDQPAMEAAGVTEDDYIKYHILEMEFFMRWLLPTASERSGRTVFTSMNVVDVTGLQLTMFTNKVRTIFRSMAKIDSDNYPETMGNTFIFGAGVVFQTIWKILSVFVDPYTRSKIRVLGSGKEAIGQLHQFIPSDVLPTFLGGRVDFEVQRRLWAQKFDQWLESEARKAGHTWMDAATAQHMKDFYEGKSLALPPEARRAGGPIMRRRRSMARMGGEIAYFDDDMGASDVIRETRKMGILWQIAYVFLWLLTLVGLYSKKRLRRAMGVEEYLLGSDLDDVPHIEVSRSRTGSNQQRRGCCTVM